MSMKYVTEFAVPIWSGMYGLNYDYDKVQKKCEELGSSKVDLSKYQEFEELHQDLLARVDAVCNCIDRRFNLRMGEAEIFINRPKTDVRYNLDSTMTLIHWVRASKKTGAIKMYTNNLLEQSNIWNSYQCQLFRSRVDQKPMTGKLIIFPSWLLHSIEASSEDDYNISLEIPLYLKEQHG